MPLAAAFTVVPIVLIAVYLSLREATGGLRCALRRDWNRASLGQRLAAAAGLVFLHVPVLVIVLYAFTTEDRTYQFPPPGLTLHWFEVAFARDDIWARCGCRCVVALRRDGDRARARHARRACARDAAVLRQGIASRCCSCCRSRCPASSPASRCSPASRSVGIDSGFWTIVVGPRHVLPRRSSTTTSSRGCAACPPSWSRRRWTSAPTASRPSATCCCRRSPPRCWPAACSPSRSRSTRSSSPLFTAGHAADAADLVLQRAVPAARAADHQRGRRRRDRS